MDEDRLPRIGAPATRALQAAGITGLSAVAAHREDEIAALHGMGPKAMRLLREALGARGLRFAGDAQDG